MARHADQPAEQVDAELLGGGGGEALQEELQQPGEAVPLEQGLQTLQALAAVGALQGQLHQQLVEEAEGQQVLKLVVRLEERRRDPEHGRHQVGGVHGGRGLPSARPGATPRPGAPLPQRRQAPRARQVAVATTQAVGDVQGVATAAVGLALAHQAGAERVAAGVAGGVAGVVGVAVVGVAIGGVVEQASAAQVDLARALPVGRELCPQQVLMGRRSKGHIR